MTMMKIYFNFPKQGQMNNNNHNKKHYWLHMAASPTGQYSNQSKQEGKIFHKLTSSCGAAAGEGGLTVGEPAIGSSRPVLQ